MVPAWLAGLVVCGQPAHSAKKYSPEALRIDLLYIQYQLLNVQANPFALHNKASWEQLFSKLEKECKDSLTAEEFVKRMSAVIALLGDEHAHLDVAAATKVSGSATSGNARQSAAEQLRYAVYGKTGYLYAGSFDSWSQQETARYGAVLDSIFYQIHLDKLNKLVIDVSENSGGNSALGEMIIEHFYTKPYLDYSCNWRRSDEYARLLDSWGFKPEERYMQLSPGKILHLPSDTIRPAPGAYTFNGKVYVMVGDGTFSSAIIFATLVKDNHLATLIGTTPASGHPTHFGELYNTTTPVLKLQLRFGVKEWIRPAGTGGENVLKPDIEMPVKGMNIASLMDRVSRL
ncbi:Peptidase family S41 [Filimonas lacunae]|uniref:Peptidase family S41 n=2 Tax=Filimonas lacunae TaxID=477680 RepID=A0A173MCH3_9BACT|nr:peptidase, S41 family [Filimonas lacunae]SIT22618.1 Peptidase family S41 [Filimonas lacunae]